LLMEKTTRGKEVLEEEDEETVGGRINKEI